MNPASQIPHPAHCYTAAQLAVASRVSKRNTLIALDGVEPASEVIVQGNPASVWTFDLLPERLRETIVARARENQLPVADYLASAIKPWQPPLALSEVSSACLDDAKKLREALLPALQRVGVIMYDAPELVRLGLADYQRVFGHPVSERHWQRLMDRTLLRDAGTKNFNRLEIYLPEKPAHKIGPGHFDQMPKDPFLLTDLISTFTDPANPTDGEVVTLFGHVFHHSGIRDATKREWKQFRRVIAKRLYLLLPCLAASQRALRVNLDRKFKRWLAADGMDRALFDGRIQKRGEPVAKPFPQPDVDKIVGHIAINCGGRVSQGIRELREKGGQSGLSPETFEVISSYHKNKSQFNRRLRERVKYEVKMIMPFFLGKKAIDDATAHVERDCSKLASMEVVNADDFTFPVYFYVPDGKGWFTLTRGQVLLMLDVRSWKIIAWSLMPQRNYDSLTIRTLMNRVCTGHGIPAVWYFERGIWKASHVVKGTVPAGWNFAGAGDDIKSSWQKIGVRFVHAIRARSKPVERVGGLLQDRMHGIRGYCGRNERVDCPEATKRAMQDVEFHRVNHPGELFLSFDEWHDQLAGIIAHYNSSSQDGRVLQGLSPDEAFQQFWPHNNPPSRLDANSWHLVAHITRPVPVTVNGIAFRIGAKSYVYRNERSGQDRGKTVLACFDPDSPEFIQVTDMNGKNPYLVERANGVNFMASPGDADFENEIAKAASHSIYPRTRFNVIKGQFAPTFRRNFVDVETAETAQEMNRLRENKIAENKEADTHKRQARKSFGRLGMVEPKKLRPGQLESAQRLAEFLKDDDQETAGNAAPENGGKVIYKLKPTGSERTKYVDYLVKRLTDFRKAGASFGQAYQTAVTVQTTHKIAASQLKCNLHDESRFDDVCAHLKANIDATILGKRNTAKGVANFHDFNSETKATHS
jgi:hypothetical protein